VNAAKYINLAIGEPLAAQLPLLRRSNGLRRKRARADEGS
jgi:hypothetical protein